MQFITSLFGGSGNTVVTAVLALAIVIVFIVLVSWLLKFINNASSNAVRGRNRRLAVVDTLNVDQKRQLLIVRRDDTEHLILIGGPQDLVIETGFAAPEPAAPPAPRRALGPKATNRPSPQPAPVPAAEVIATDSSEPQITAAPGTVLEQLQRAGHPADKKGHISLRHTGLLRQSGKGKASSEEQKPENSPETAIDSGKQNIDVELGGNASVDEDTKTDAKRS